MTLKIGTVTTGGLLSCVFSSSLGYGDRLACLRRIQTAHAGMLLRIKRQHPNVGLCHDEARQHFRGNANLRLAAEVLVLKLISLTHA